MPNYVQDYSIPEAAGAAQVVGQNLSQALVGLPQARAEMAMRLAQFQQQQRQQQLMMGLQQQRLQGQNEYHQGMLGVRGDEVNNQNQNAQTLNAIREQQSQVEQLRAIIEGIRGGVIAPMAQQGGVGVGGATQQGLSNNPPNPQQLGGSGGNNGMQVPGAGGFQFTQPGMNQRPPNAMTNNQLDENKLKALSLWGNFMSSTNPQMQWGANQASNMVMNPQQGGIQMPTNQLPQSLQGTNRVRNFNSMTGILE